MNEDKAHCLFKFTLIKTRDKWVFTFLQADDRFCDYLIKIAYNWIFIEKALFLCQNLNIMNYGPD